MIEQSLVPRPPLHHVEPVEVPNEAHGGSVKPFSTSVLHEVGLGSPDEEEEYDPRAEEVGEDEARQHRGEEGEGGDARHDEKKVPEEVDDGGEDHLLLFFREEGAQRAVVHGHTAGDGGG